MRVDDQIGLHAALGEGHVDCRPELRQHTLLTVTRGELVTNDRLAGNAVLDTERLSRLVARLGTDDSETLDVAFLGILVFHVVGDSIDVNVRVGGWIESHTVPGRDLVTFLDASTQVRHAIFVDDVAHLLFDLVAGSKPKQLGDLTLGLIPTGVVVG